MPFTMATSDACLGESGPLLHLSLHRGSRVSGTTNLLTVSNGQDFPGGVAELPVTAPGMIARRPGVTAVQDIGLAGGVSAYKSPYIPPIETNGTGTTVRLGSRSCPDRPVTRRSTLRASSHARAVALALAVPDHYQAADH
jgi:hypothetical protein